MANSLSSLTAGVGGVQISSVDTSGSLDIKSGTTTIVSITSAGAAVTGTLSASGNLLAGTTSPLQSSQLTVYASPTPITTIDRTTNIGATVSCASSGTGYIQGGVRLGTEGNSGIYGYDDGTSGAQGIGIFTGNNTTIAERMRIDSSGNVMIGTTTANTYTTGLAVRGQISAQANGISAVSLVNVCRNYNNGSNIFSFALPNAPSSTSNGNIAQTWMINIWCNGDATHGEINTLLVTFYGPTTGGITVTSLQQQIMGGTSAALVYTRIANAGGDLLQMSGNNYSRIKSVNIVQLGGN
jgi:hypothetical protein